MPTSVADWKFNSFVVVWNIRFVCARDRDRALLLFDNICFGGMTPYNYVTNFIDFDGITNWTMFVWFEHNRPNIYRQRDRKPVTCTQNVQTNFSKRIT